MKIPFVIKRRKEEQDPERSPNYHEWTFLRSTDRVAQTLSGQRSGKTEGMARYAARLAVPGKEQRKLLAQRGVTPPEGEPVRGVLAVPHLTHGAGLVGRFLAELDRLGVEWDRPRKNLIVVHGKGRSAGSTEVRVATFGWPSSCRGQMFDWLVLDDCAQHIRHFEELLLIAAPVAGCVTMARDLESLGEQRAWNEGLLGQPQAAVA